MAKGRDSGMPEAEKWETFFNTDKIMDAFGCRDLIGDVVEFGCGYGTFTIPTARKIRGKVYTLDIEPLMVRATATRSAEAGLKNVMAEERDFVTRGSGLASNTAALALLFNILHIEDPVALLKEAYRVLHSGGAVAIIHWNHDARTPRGPPLAIRPLPEQCRSWGEQVGFKWKWNASFSGSPWHWGMLMEKS